MNAPVAARTVHGEPVTGAPASKSKPRKKKRVRGEKPRERTVLRQYERPAELRLGRGRTRALDVAPTRTAETAVPRRLRALFAAKARIEKQSSDRQILSISARRVSGPAVVENGDDQKSARGGAHLSKVNHGKSVKPLRRMSRNEILIQSVRKNSHQVEKKRAYFAKKAERAQLRKERRKRKRSGHDSDSSDPADSESDGAAPVKRPRFGEQALAPPRLVPVAKRGRSQPMVIPARQQGSM
jgi:hypothetical protein